MSRKHKATMEYMGSSHPVDYLLLVAKVPGEETYHFLRSKKFSNGVRKISVKKKVTGEMVVKAIPDENQITGTMGLRLKISDLSSIIQSPQ